MTTSRLTAACSFGWCENTWNGHREHAWHDSVPGANVTGSTERAVSVWTSVGPEYDEPVMVSIEEPDSDGSYGGEVWLNLDNAIYLRDALTAAIDHAREWSKK